MCINLTTVASVVPELSLRSENLKLVTWFDHAPTLLGTVCRPYRLGLNYNQPVNKSTDFEGSTFTHYKYTTGNAKRINWRLWVTQGHRQHNHSIERDFLLNFNRNDASILYCFRVTTDYLSELKSLILTYPTCI